MFPSQVVFLLFAQVLFCSQRQKVQSLVSSQPGPYGFALNSKVPYKPPVPMAHEPEEDTSRRQELFKNTYRVDLASGVAAVQSGVESQATIPQTELSVSDELEGINILEDVDMGRWWSIHHLNRCESRVSVFNVPQNDDVRAVLRIMIKFGPITEAWMIKDSKYGRPNIVLIEYTEVLDARHAIAHARGTFPTSVGVSPCKGDYVFRLTSLKINLEQASEDMKQYFEVEFLEKKFGPVVDKYYDEKKRVAFVTFNWLSDKDKARDFFKSKRCHVIN